MISRDIRSGPRDPCSTASRKRPLARIHRAPSYSCGVAVWLHPVGAFEQGRPEDPGFFSDFFRPDRHSRPIAGVPAGHDDKRLHGRRPAGRCLVQLAATRDDGVCRPVGRQAVNSSPYASRSRPSILGNSECRNLPGSKACLRIATRFAFNRW